MNEAIIEIPLEVECAFKISGSGGVVVVRRLAATEFTLSDSSTLDGCALYPLLDVPRAFDDEGQPRYDLVALTLRSEEDVASFSKGQRATLRAHPVGGT